MDKKRVVVIIGAGPAGLTAAYELLKKSSDIKPIVLETERFVGGISRTAEYKGNRMDIGGHRFFSKDERVNALWAEILPTQGAPAHDDKILGREKPLVLGNPDPEQTDDVMLIRDRVSRIIYKRKFFDYPITLSARTLWNMGFFQTLKAGFGYLGAKLKKREETNLENFYINRFGKPLYATFFESYTEKLWGVHPRNISADWGAQRVKGLSIGKAIKNALTKPFRKKGAEQETSLIERFIYPKKGPGQLYQKMADEIVRMGGEIRFGETVCKISLEGEKVRSVSTRLQSGETREYTAEHFLSSMPIKDLFVAIGRENAPKNVYDVATALPYRDFMTVGLLVDKLKVKNKTKKKTLGNIVPDCWIYVQDRSVTLGRIQIFNNWSPYMVDEPDKKVWLGLEYFCDEGDGMWTSDDFAFIQNAVKELVEIGVIESENAVLNSTLLRVKKAYPVYFGSYKDFELVKAWLNDVDNLWCIGRNGQHRYNNMDHSMATAMLACERIIRGETDKEAVWNVNTEKSYHETKGRGQG
ncbi:MAG: NAD(P)/FAD-dependent oxidoreductase [Clostridia bacterium]|nr:NAD(P)/FAD-dependent oxidoreductase [Clostridia bacterium]